MRTDFEIDFFVFRLIFDKAEVVHCKRHEVSWHQNTLFEVDPHPTFETRPARRNTIQQSRSIMQLI